MLILLIGLRLGGSMARLIHPTADPTRPNGDILLGCNNYLVKQRLRYLSTSSTSDLNSDVTPCFRLGSIER